MNNLLTLDRPIDRAEGKLPSLHHELADYYRCPGYIAPFLPAHSLAINRGYFRLGGDTLCYGQLATDKIHKSPEGDLQDALFLVGRQANGTRLPFDPQEIIENLRRERYSTDFRGEGRALNDLVRKIYYLLRPFLGVPVRRHLQKLHLSDWKKIRFPAWPVDTTVERIHRILLALAMKEQGVRKIPFIWFWPEGFSSCTNMTHDIESTPGRDFCPRLMDLDESFGIRSAFQVVPENRYSVSRDFLQSLKSRGFEVNVHDLKHDGRLYANRAEFLRRAAHINRYIQEYGAQGFRSGILYRNADWYEAFDFSYDMSIPNVAHLDPQRGGCCTVLPYFIGKIVELPLTTTQDYTLFHIFNDYSINLWERQTSLIRKHYGLASFIVHPDYIRERKAQDSYRALLDHLSRIRTKENIWMPLPRDVAVWWRERNQMELVYKHGQWQVEGPGKERARVAYALLAGDEVTYELDRQPPGNSNAELAALSTA